MLPLSGLDHFGAAFRQGAIMPRGWVLVNVTTPSLQI